MGKAKASDGSGSKRARYEERTAEYLKPILDEKGFELYDIEYVKEAGDYYLRAYIDKPDGVTIDDCVEVSREMNIILDREDYVEDEYIFEVSSPGVQRRLKKEKHFKDAYGKEVEVKLYAPLEGSKERVGILKAYKYEVIELLCGEDDNNNDIITIPLSKVASCRLAFH